MDEHNRNTERTKLNIRFTKLTEPTPEIASSFNKWENDPQLIPLIRPNRDKEALSNQELVTVESLSKRLEHYHIYLIYLNDVLIGDMNYKIDPPYLYKKETGTAWLGINIGEVAGRGKGVGLHAFQYLEEQIKQAGLKRMELGVFEFNEQAIRLYKKAGFKEIARIDAFTFWQDKMWQDIRMEKYIE